MIEPELQIAGRPIGAAHPPYVIAEMSANHGGDFDTAVKLVRAAAEQGADAIKLQTYTPETMTLDCDADPFRIRGTIWDGRTLHDLYREAQTPWAWHAKLKQAAQEAGITLFSTPFDATAVEFLQSLHVPAYKIASFELVDLPLLEKVARTGQPVLLSTGMATEAEIEDAVRTIRQAGGRGPVLLKCTSAYPAPAETMNLRTIPYLSERFDTPVGLSDHTRSDTVAVAAVAVGAVVIEKHLTLSRQTKTADASFSLEPAEFDRMVRSVHEAYLAMGSVQREPGVEEEAARRLRRSLFVVEEIKRGEPLTEENIRSIRPGDGLAPKYLDQILGRVAARDLACGTPLGWEDIR